MSKKLTLQEFDNLDIELIFVKDSEKNNTELNDNEKFSFEKIIKKRDFSKKETNKKNCRFFKNIDFLRNDKIARVLF